MVTRISNQHGREVHEFVKAVIRRRRSLITTRKSSINNARAEKIIDRLERNNHKNFSDRGATMFLLDNEEDIRYLIKQDDIDKFNTLNKLYAKSNKLSVLWTREKP